MRLSVNIVLDSIRSYNPQNYIENTEKNFSGVGIGVRSGQGLYLDQIYVCNLSDFKNMQGRDRNVCLIIVKSPKEHIPDGISLFNTIVVDFEGGVIDFFSYIQSIFSTIFEWCSKMDEYIIRKRSIQELLTLSETVIGNYITISDSSFALVAYTEGLECNDPLTMNLVKKGYHDQDAIDLFNKYKLPEQWRDAIDIYEKDSPSVCNCPIVCKVVHYYNNYYSHITMLCNNKKPTKGIIDLFKMLVDHLMVCFERQWLDNNQMPHIHDNLLIALTGPNNLSEDAIRNRARNSGLPFMSRFRFLRITQEDSSNNIMSQRIEREIISYIPDAKVTLYKQGLMVLLVSPAKGRDKFPEILENLMTILKRYKASCGISDEFSFLPEIKLANEQATVALSCCTPEQAVFFNDCYPKYLLTADPQNALLANSTIASKMLKEINEYDLKHNTNNYELLYEYLRFDRKATETAEKMHMHRNNVIYRIGRICEQINVDLDNPDIRLRILLAYEIFTRKAQKE